MFLLLFLWDSLPKKETPKGCNAKNEHTRGSQVWSSVCDNVAPLNWGGSGSVIKLGHRRSFIWFLQPVTNFRITGSGSGAGNSPSSNHPKTACVHAREMPKYTKPCHRVVFNSHYYQTLFYSIFIPSWNMQTFKVQIWRCLNIMSGFISYYFFALNKIIPSAQVSSMTDYVRSPSRPHSDAHLDRGHSLMTWVQVNQNNYLYCHLPKRI